MSDWFKHEVLKRLTAIEERLAALESTLSGLEQLGNATAALKESGDKLAAALAAQEKK